MCDNFKAHGKGVFQTLSGYKYSGYWANDLKNGKGEELFPNGVIF